MSASAATLSIFNHLFASVAEEMGVTLERTAYSANIKERLDFSCALFLGDGRMLLVNRLARVILIGAALWLALQRH